MKNPPRNCYKTLLPWSCSNYSIFLHDKKLVKLFNSHACIYLKALQVISSQLYTCPQVELKIFFLSAKRENMFSAP